MRSKFLKAISISLLLASCATNPFRQPNSDVQGDVYNLTQPQFPLYREDRILEQQIPIGSTISIKKPLKVPEYSYRIYIQSGVVVPRSNSHAGSCVISFKENSKYPRNLKARTMPIDEKKIQVGRMGHKTELETSFVIFPVSDSGVVSVSCSLNNSPNFTITTIKKLLEENGIQLNIVPEPRAEKEKIESF